MPDAGKTGKGKYCSDCRKALRSKNAKFAHDANLGRKRPRALVVGLARKKRKARAPSMWEHLLLFAHPEEYSRIKKLRVLWDSHGIEGEDWARLWEKQKGLCPVCGLALSGMVHVDHDHSLRGAESVRGLLHWQCNAYKVCKNNLESARRVVRYLEAFELGKS